MKRIAVLFCTAVLAASTLAGCGGSTPPVGSGSASAVADSSQEAVLKDGVYSAAFDTDSSMFGVNETCDGRGTLTVEGGEMVIHVTLKSQKIVNLFAGTAEDAQKDGAAILEPTIDTVTYPDGISEEVYGFDIPVPSIDEEFDVALLGTKGKWYDHKVVVSDPVEQQESSIDLADGSYTCNVALEGGSGKVTLGSPATLSVEGGVVMATIQWSSPNYDYMIVNDERIEPTSTEGGSVFTIPVAALDTPLSVIADTVAMSTPHEIEYTLTFDSASLAPVGA